MGGIQGVSGGHAPRPTYGTGPLSETDAPTSAPAPQAGPRPAEGDGYAARNGQRSGLAMDDLPNGRGARPPQDDGFLAGLGQDREAIVQEALKDGPKGVVGEAVEYWQRMGQEEGAAGYVGKAMSGLLELSGLPAYERSAQELGARVGAGDSASNIAKTGGKLLFDGGMVALNGFAGGKVVTGLVRGKNAAAALPNVVRHYTNAETAAKIMQSGEIWASKAGNAGLNKVYLLAEEGGNQGMNFLRRLNIGYGSSGKTAKAIEIDLTKLPPDVVANFQRSVASGPLNLEKFMTHQGNFNFEKFRDAVRVVDTQQMATTMAQLSASGASMAKLGQLGVNTYRGSQGTLQ